MILKLKYFGMLSEVLGRKEESFHFSEVTVQELDEVLRAKYSKLKELNYTFAVNKNMVDELCKLNEKDEVALLPPFAGG